MVQHQFCIKEFYCGISTWFCNHFYHYSDFGTNYIDKKGDYGYCYGIYDSNDIEFLDGPF